MRYATARRYLPIVAVFLFALVTFMAIRAQNTEAAGPPTVIAAVGVVPGTDLTVEVIELVPAGQNPEDVAVSALARQGARPVSPSAYSLTGLVWPQFSSGTTNPTVVQNYNPANDPTGVGDAVLQSTQSTWTNVSDSNFSLSWGENTVRCPSLVRECKGPQVRDGYNDVGWLSIGGSTTLAVTWSTTSGTPEADMGINLNFPWRTDGTNYDLESVVLHENGHVAGLGHSADKTAVMYAYYHGVVHTLQTDDINGIVALYPSGSTPTPTPTPSPTTTPAPTGVSISAINPNAGRVGTSVDVTITGAGFASGATLSLESGSGPSPSVSSVVVVDDTSITATISIPTGGPPRARVWSVRVTNPDGATDVLSSGFTVNP